jgi:oligosaccharide repeat unit polymerase
MFEAFDFSNFILILYIFIWIFTLFIYQYFKRQVDGGTILLGFYLLYSIISFLLYNSEFFKFEKLTIFPFIYLYGLLILTFSPILIFDSSKIILNKPSTLFFNFVSIIYIFFSLIQLPGIISNFGKSIVQLLLVSSGGLDLYRDALSESVNLGDQSISNLPSIITNAYGNFGILLLFYYLTYSTRNYVLLIGLIISSIIGILGNVSLGQRGPIVEILFTFIITFFALHKFYTKKVKKVFLSIGLFFLLLTVVPVVILTNSRFSETNAGATSFVYYYAGQQNLIFNNYGLNNGGIRYGDRTFPFFKQLIGFENVPNNFWERRNKYPNLYVDDELFIGFIGDFTLDFGPFIAPIILLLFTFLVFLCTRIYNRSFYFHQFIVLHFLMTVCMIGGLKLYPYSDLGGNIQLIAYFFAYLFFKIDYDLNIKGRCK